MWFVQRQVGVWVGITRLQMNFMFYVVAYMNSLYRSYVLANLLKLLIKYIGIFIIYIFNQWFLKLYHSIDNTSFAELIFSFEYEFYDNKQIFFLKFRVILLQ